MQTILLNKKTVFGRELIYPACDNSELFATLLKVKSFNEDQIAKIARLGFRITYAN